MIAFLEYNNIDLVEVVENDIPTLFDVSRPSMSFDDKKHYIWLIWLNVNVLSEHSNVSFVKLKDSIDHLVDHLMTDGLIDSVFIT